MMRMLLWRGMLAGLVGAFVAATFALLFAEPNIEAAIALEAHSAMHAAARHEEIVSRGVQKTWGLYTALGLYGTALGGMMAILFAAMYGRVARCGPRSLALLLALAAFVIVVLVPGLKYPPTPPAVGLHDTLRLRTAAYFAMLALSIASATAALWSYHRLGARYSGPDRLMMAAGLYVALVALGQLLLPVIDEVTAEFPASLLWQFRLTSIGTQAVFWLVSGDLFGRTAERLIRDQAVQRARG